MPLSLSLLHSHLSSSLSQLWSHSLNSGHRSIKLDSSSLSQLRSHSFNSDHWPMKFAADRSAWLGNLWSSPLIGVLACGYWFFHAANACITPPIWDLGLFFSSCCGLLVVVTLISQAHSLNSDHRPTKLAVDWSAWLWNPWSSLLIGVLACGYWFFHAADRRFGFFFSCCGLVVVVVVLIVVVAVVVRKKIGDLGFFFFAMEWWWWWCWWWLWLWLCLHLLVGYIILLE